MVDITPDKTQKFFIVSLVDGTKSLVGDPNAEFHKDIVARLEGEGEGNPTKVLGGGRLHIRSNERTIYLWGSSTRYGDFESDLAVSLLEDMFSEYKIITRNPDFE